MKSSALSYAAKNVSVIPVGRDKKPLINWKEFQTRRATPEEIEAWWTKYPEANVGIVTGKISNLAVVDVEKGGDISPFPETDTVATGGGGWHLYYHYEEGVDNKARIFPLTDIRGEGGYIVAPPSIHASGTPYKLIKHVGRKPFPKYVFEGIEKPTNHADWQNILRGTPEGSRNETMAKVIGRYMNAFHPSEWESVLYPFIQYHNQKNNPPLDERELRSIWQSIGKRAATDNKVEKAPEDTEVLPLAEVAKFYDNQQTDHFKTGVPPFDKAMNGGFMDGDLIVITGQTGQGKTTFAQTLTKDMTEVGTGCLWFSYEVLMNEFWKKFKAMGVSDDMIAYSPIKMVSGDISWIEQKIIDSKEKYGTKVVFIDHLGRLSKKVRNMADANNISSYLGAICQELKAMAVEHRVVIVLLAHVRKIDGRDDIGTDDIGHSVGISQEADMVFVVRRSKKAQDDDEDKDSVVKIIKNRRTGARPYAIMRMENGRLSYQEGIGEGKY